MTSSAVVIPLALRQALELGECVLFLGAGAGANLLRSDGTPLPDASALASHLAKTFSVDTSSTDLSKVSELLQIRGKGQELIDSVRKAVSDATPDNFFQWIASRRWRAIFTTNYDRGIERAYELQKNPPQLPISISRTSQARHIEPQFEVAVYHVHGSLFGENQSIVISQSDYSRFRESRRMIFEILKQEFASSTILYIGYSNRDPNWALVLSEITEEFQPSRLPPSFRISPTTDSDDREILKARGIESVDANLAEFVAAASAQLTPFNVDASRLKALEKTVPSNLRGLFDQNPAPVVRLINSWQYVNEVDIGGRPNTRDYFRGDKANWSLIGRDIAFERDVSEEIYEDVLDYVTSPAQRPTTLVILGPAGYGATTALMALAVRLVKERIGPVYFLRPKVDVLDGDVSFSIHAAGKQVATFFIDDASEVLGRINEIVNRLRDAKQPAVFVCASRTNEWRQRGVRIPTKEYPLLPLSEPEIGKLLGCLERNNELNKLEALEHDFRWAVIRQKHGKELLVVMRESTEDKRFDAILEDEFFGISDERSRIIYLIVCAFHQHGGLVRSDLLCATADIEVSEFYSLIRRTLEGVVIDECTNAATAQYSYRSRHRTIAAAVWNRCGERGQKDDILFRILARLNLTYREDANAFEQFVRNDVLVDSIRGLDNKIRYFELACKKDPDGPYVRQHYARMLYRENRLDLALAQVDQGISINPRTVPRVLLHTKGTILGAMALSSESSDVGRRRLAQAEEVLRRAMASNPRDDYTYHTLASLYLDWAKRSTDTEESALYLTKAEETISQGLRTCREKDAMWIVSSQIEEWLGHRPAQIEALEKAVRTTAGSIIARYLLGRAYRMLHRYQEAKTVLEPNVKSYPDEFRSFIEYALVEWALGKSLRGCIALLEIASGNGLSDAKYIAHLAGMHFLAKDFARAEEVSNEIYKRELPASVLNWIAFKPIDPVTKQGLEFSGRVTKVTGSFSRVEVDGFPLFTCQSSKYGPLNFRVGMVLEFRAGFSPRGPMVTEPREVEVEKGEDIPIDRHPGSDNIETVNL